MVTLTHWWSRFVAWFLSLVFLFAPLGRIVRDAFAGAWDPGVAIGPIEQPYFADLAESGLIHPIDAKPAPEAVPPPAPSMPIGNRFVSAHPQEDEFYYHPSWGAAGRNRQMMMMFRAASALVSPPV